MVGRYHQLSRHEFEQAPLRKLSSGHIRYVDDTTLTAESEELKSLLMKVKVESKKLT